VTVFTLLVAITVLAACRLASMVGTLNKASCRLKWLPVLFHIWVVRLRKREVAPAQVHFRLRPRRWCMSLTWSEGVAS